MSQKSHLLRLLPRRLVRLVRLCKNECQSGGPIGPSFGLTPPSNCATWSWYWLYCPETPQDECVKYTDCVSCVNNGQLSPCCKPPCGWCTTADGVAGSCQSGSISGPWGSTRCLTSSPPYWVWSQFDTSDKCPAPPASSTPSRSFSVSLSSSISRSSSAPPSSSSGGADSSTASASPIAGSESSSVTAALTSSVTPSPSPTGSPGGGGGGGGGSDNARAVDVSALVGGLAGALAALVVSLCVAAFVCYRMHRQRADGRASEATSIKQGTGGADITLSPLAKAQLRAPPQPSPPRLQGERRDRVAALSRQRSIEQGEEEGPPPS